MSPGAAGPLWLRLLEACPPCLGEGSVPVPVAILEAVLEAWRPWVSALNRRHCCSLCCLLT